MLDPTARQALAPGAEEPERRDPAISLAEPNYLIPIRSDISGFLYEPDSLLTYRLLIAEVTSGEMHP